MQGVITAVDISAARLGAVRSAATAAGVPDSMISCVAGDFVNLSAHAPEQLSVPAATGSGEAASGDGGSSGSRLSQKNSIFEPGSGKGLGSAASISSLSAGSAPELYDRVLVDAPCSGSGVLAKRADLRWRRQAEDMPQLLTTQAKLLDAAAALVRPGGTLVYSTCR